MTTNMRLTKTVAPKPQTSVSLECSVTGRSSKNSEAIHLNDPRAFVVLLRDIESGTIRASPKSQIRGRPSSDIKTLESLRFRLVAYSRCASHGRSAPRCALRFRHFFNEGSGELEIWYHKLQVALYMRHIIYKIIFEANNCLGCKDESPATRPFPSQKGKCISYAQVCSPPCTKHLWYSIILSFHHSHSSV